MQYWSHFNYSGLFFYNLVVQHDFFLLIIQYLANFIIFFFRFCHFVFNCLWLIIHFVNHIRSHIYLRIEVFIILWKTMANVHVVLSLLILLVLLYLFRTLKCMQKIIYTGINDVLLLFSRTCAPIKAPGWIFFGGATASLKFIVINWRLRTAQHIDILLPYIHNISKLIDCSFICINCIIFFFFILNFNSFYFIKPASREINIRGTFILIQYISYISSRQLLLWLQTCPH